MVSTSTYAMKGSSLKDGGVVACDNEHADVLVSVDVLGEWAERGGECWMDDLHERLNRERLAVVTDRVCAFTNSEPVIWTHSGLCLCGEVSTRPFIEPAEAVPCKDSDRTGRIVDVEFVEELDIDGGG